MDSIRTHEENIMTHHKVGLQYIQLSKDTLKLADRYKSKIGSEIEDLSWDFIKLHELYKNLGERFARIGNALTNL